MLLFYFPDRFNGGALIKIAYSLAQLRFDASAYALGRRQFACVKLKFFAYTAKMDVVAFPAGPFCQL